MDRTKALALIVPYLLLLFYVTLVFHTERRVGPEQRLMLVPLQTTTTFVREALAWSRQPSPWAFYVIGRGFGVNVVGNLAVFLPLGFLLPALRERRTTARHVLLAGLVLSTTIEALQYLSGRRTADVDDVLLNTLSALLGYYGLVAWRACTCAAPQHSLG